MKTQIPFFVSIVAFLIIGFTPLNAESIWTQINMPVKDTLLAVDFTSPEDGWAVGLNSRILHWDGKQWNIFPSPVKTHYNAIQMLDRNDGWAVGHAGIIIHWNGEQWNDAISPTDHSLYDISFLSPTLGWAVGGQTGVTVPGNPATLYADRIVLRWDGVNWNTVPAPEQHPLNWELLSIGMVSENDGWAGGTGEILRWDGKEWISYVSTIPHFDYLVFEDIQVLGPQDVWFVGRHLSTETGHILHWDGFDLKEIFQVKWGLYTINIISPNFGWAGGGNNFSNEGGSVLLQWDGLEWKEIQSPTILPLRFLWAKSKLNGWMLAGGNDPNSGYEGEAFRVITENTSNETPTLPATTSPTNIIPLPITQTVSSITADENQTPNISVTPTPNVHSDNRNIRNLSIIIGGTSVLLILSVIILSYIKGRKNRM